jgi:hypothetical protein
MMILEKWLAVPALGLAVTVLASPSYAQGASSEINSARAAALRECSPFIDDWGYRYRACMIEHGQQE